MALVSSLGWLVGLLPGVALPPAAVPGRTPPSRRWLPFALAVRGGARVPRVPRSSGRHRRLVGRRGLANPLFVPGLGGREIPDSVFYVSSSGCSLGSVVSLVLRFRRSRGVERQQIKWIAFAVAFVASSFVLSTVAWAVGLRTSIVAAVSGIAASPCRSPWRSPCCGTASGTWTSWWKTVLARSRSCCSRSSGSSPWSGPPAGGPRGVERCGSRVALVVVLLGLASGRSPALAPPDRPDRLRAPRGAVRGPRPSSRTGSATYVDEDVLVGWRPPRRGLGRRLVDVWLRLGETQPAATWPPTPSPRPSPSWRRGPPDDRGEPSSRSRSVASPSARSRSRSRRATG